jgi:hypothetical protein
MSIEYGFNMVTVGDDRVESQYILFGDGLNRVSSVFFDDGTAGIQILRDDSESEPFAIYSAQEAQFVNNMPENEKVYIAFDNPKSIDVLINRLLDAKNSMELGEQK